MHHIHITAANVANITLAGKFLHDEENIVTANAGYSGIEKRKEHAFDLRGVILGAEPYRKKAG